MKREKIGNILQMQRGYDLPSSQMKEGNIPVVGSNGIVGYHNTSKCILPTITIGRSGSAGKVHYYEEPTWVHNTALYLTDFKENNPKYLYYLLQLLHLEKLCGSSVIPSLNRNVVYPMVVNFHEDRHEQDAIANILSLIDKKIALNREINRNLEAMARQLYDYWFVQFDFPDENGKPYKSSGGKMVWNERLKREIPDGWKDVDLKEYLKCISERIQVSERDGYIYTPIEVLARKQMSFSDYAPIEEATSGLCKYRESDILLSNRRVYFHKVCIAPSDGITRDTVIVLRSQADLLGYSFQLVFSDHFISYATHHSYGSEQPVLSWEAAKKYKVLKPSLNLDYKYSSISNNIISQIISNEREIREMVKYRDELLPLLMNGQASVMPPEVNCDLSHD